MAWLAWAALPLEVMNFRTPAHLLSIVSCFVPTSARVALGAAAPRLHAPTSVRLLASLESSSSKRAARRGRAQQRGKRAAQPLETPSSSSSSAVEAEVAQVARLLQPRKLLDLYEESLEEHRSDEVQPEVVRALLRMRQVDAALELHH